MKEKRPISTVQTALQMSSGKKKNVKRLTLYKLKNSTFLMSVNGIFGLNVSERAPLPEAKYKHEKRECCAVLLSSPFEDARGLCKH